MIENRKSRAPRKKATLKLSYGKPGVEPDQMGWTVNVCTLGLFVATSTLVTVGQMLWFRVHLPDRKVQLRGQVVWQRKSDREQQAVIRSGFGVKLNHAPDAWRTFVMQHSGAFAF